MSKVGIFRLILNWDGEFKYSSAEVLDQEFFRYGFIHHIHEKYGPMMDDEVNYLDYLYMVSDMSSFDYLEGYKAGYYEVVGELSLDSYRCNHPQDPEEWDMDIDLDNLKIQELTEEQASIYFDEVDEEELELCPSCGEYSVGAEWSGVACKNNKCSYTFCY